MTNFDAGASAGLMVDLDSLSVCRNTNGYRLTIGIQRISASVENCRAKDKRTSRAHMVTMYNARLDCGRRKSGLRLHTSARTAQQVKDYCHHSAS